MNKVEIELTDEQLKQISNLAEIRGCSAESLATDVVVMFLSNITAPIIQLPKAQAHE